MPVELKVPELGESINEVQIGDWLKQPGDRVAVDEPLVEIESEKATVQVPSPVSGVLAQVLKKKGDFANVRDVIAYLEEGDGVGDGAGKAAAQETKKKPKSSPEKSAPPADTKKLPDAPRPRTSESGNQTREPRAPAPDAPTTAASQPPASAKPSQSAPVIMPAAQRLMVEHGLETKDVTASGPGGRILKEDVLRVVEQRDKSQAAAPPGEEDEPPAYGRAGGADGREEEAVRMSPMRRSIAARLVEAQRTAALLTTFNEIDMSALMQLRKERQVAFQAKYGVKLGIMSTFVKASIDALKQFPQVNAEVREDQIVYRNYYDIGIAIGTGRGLVVPILRNADRLSFAEIELAIADFSQRAGEKKIDMEELRGGTFSITNGGVFGSMLSTPIVNPPQSAILGMHAIQDRPLAVNGAVEIRPAMYVALTYDHRVIDGREAVLFLVRIKECVENPLRMLLEV